MEKATPGGPPNAFQRKDAKRENYFLKRLPRESLALREQPWANFLCLFEAIQFLPSSDYGAISSAFAAMSRRAGIHGLIKR
jgi:hypothetical protein